MSKFITDLKEKVFCRIGVSKIHGVGVIAIRRIPKDINPMQEMKSCEFVVVKGKEMQAAFQSISPEIKDLVVAMCPERKDEDEWDCPKNGLNSIGVAWYLNHSTTPNMEEMDGDFFSLRDIEVGEELTVDYGTYGALNL